MNENNNKKNSIYCCRLSCSYTLSTITGTKLLSALRVECVWLLLRRIHFISYTFLVVSLLLFQFKNAFMPPTTRQNYVILVCSAYPLTVRSNSRPTPKCKRSKAHARVERERRQQNFSAFQSNLIAFLYLKNTIASRLARVRVSIRNITVDFCSFVFKAVV